MAAAQHRGALAVAVRPRAPRLLTAVPHLGLYRRATAVALIVAPALFLLDNLLHPKEYTRGNYHEAEQLREIADNYTRWQVAHLLGFVAILIFAAGLLGLAFLVRRRRPLAGLVGGAMGIVGLLGLAAAIALDGFTWGILGHVARRAGAGAAQALDEIQNSGWAWQYYAPGLLFALALILLGRTLALTRAVPPWAGWLLALGGLLAGTEGIVVSNAYFIAGAAVLLAGSGAVGVAIGRMSDEEFAGREAILP
ncbi:MAG: hypothetical protein QOG86_1718 [Thermoleophilaceae bacterium]|nr:hypothetical protein [Thermoleophilaceae bacterium]MEA2350777.1 hypothetical protein [Thermoleophilaceae bacterium]MEA2352768.1 hypothetical protein [Thermoleophilaceae bacterium]